jgi:hypothetical protein
MVSNCKRAPGDRRHQVDSRSVFEHLLGLGGGAIQANEYSAVDRQRHCAQHVGHL